MRGSGFPWRAAFLMSVALNVIVASAALGAVLAGARLERPAGVGLPREANVRAFMHALPPETRRALRRNLARRFMAMGEERSAARAARFEVYAAAGAEPYNVERVRAAFAESRSADAALGAAVHDAVAEAIGELSPEQRQAAMNAVRNRALLGDGSGRD